MMFPIPRNDLKPNTAEFEQLPLVKPTGFREYDARWLFPDEINLMGMRAIGLGLERYPTSLDQFRFATGVCDPVAKRTRRDARNGDSSPLLV